MCDLTEIKNLPINGYKEYSLSLKDNRMKLEYGEASSDDLSSDWDSDENLKKPKVYYTFWIFFIKFINYLKYYINYSKICLNA